MTPGVRIPDRIEDFIDALVGPRSQPPVELAPLATPVQVVIETATTPPLPQPAGESSDPVERFVRGVQDGTLTRRPRRRLPSVRLPQPQPGHITRLVELTGVLLVIAGLWAVWPPAALIIAGVSGVLWAAGDRARATAEIIERSRADGARNQPWNERN